MGGERLDITSKFMFLKQHPHRNKIVGSIIIILCTTIIISHPEISPWYTNHEMEWDMIPFDVQIMGAIVLHGGNIAEMATGEGKTLVATMPLYLNALTGKNCQLVTVNDFLAKRDSEWMGAVFEYLGFIISSNIYIEKHMKIKDKMWKEFLGDEV